MSLRPFSPENHHPRPTLDPQDLYFLPDGGCVDPSMRGPSQDVAGYDDDWQPDSVYPPLHVGNGPQGEVPVERGSRRRHGKPRKSSGPATVSSPRSSNKHRNDSQKSSKKRGGKPVYAPDADDESADDHDVYADPYADPYADLYADPYADLYADPYEPGKQLALERNRVAATKCRLKKKDEISRLAAHERAMEEENQSLSERVQDLRHEVTCLKTKLLQHTDCNCVLIQQFISNEARRVALADDSHHTSSLSLYSPSETDISQPSLDYTDYQAYNT